jgi:hypothetical protein
MPVRLASHVSPQLIPAGAEVTVPEPNPVFNTRNAAAFTGAAIPNNDNKATMDEDTLVVLMTPPDR